MYPRMEALLNEDRTISFCTLCYTSVYNYTTHLVNDAMFTNSQCNMDQTRVKQTHSFVICDNSLVYTFTRWKVYTINNQLCTVE